MSGSYVALGEERIWIEQRGAGDDLILLCGLGDAHDAWSHQLETLSTDYRVTSIDNRGVGRSTLPSGPFTVADMAADTAAVLDDLEVRQAHVAGFSMGGAIAQELALARPDLVRSLTLVGTWCRTDEHQRRLFEAWAWMAERAESDEAFVRALFLWVYTRRAHLDGSIEGWVQGALTAAHPQSTDAFVQTVAAIVGHDAADRLDAISVPSLVIAGEDDAICPPDVQRDLADRIPGSTVTLLSAEAHQPFQESPAVFDERLRDFLASCP